MIRNDKALIIKKCWGVIRYLCLLPWLRHPPMVSGHRLPLLPWLLPVVLLLFSVHRTQCSESEGLAVGVILDNSTWLGNISWSCMSMAMEDFYAANPVNDRNASSKLALHYRDANVSDNLAAATAAVDLLENVQVNAIIGPQSSSQAKFVIELGFKTHVPIVSFSAKSPSLSSAPSRYFVRTTINDCFQARVIASIVEAFRWREVVPIFEDTEYGNGIMPFLIDAVQDVDAAVPYRSPIPFSAKKKQIMRELKKLKNMRTRVFVVHTTYDLGFQIFLCANESGMMKEGYVWIATYGLIDIINLIGSPAANSMQGILGIKPYMKINHKVRSFNARWKKMFNFKNRDGKLIDPTIFGLWAYDTVWLLGIAAKKFRGANYTHLSSNISNVSTDLQNLGSSQVGRKLLQDISNIDFSGLSGKFHVINNQLESKVFEIVNVVGGEQRSIGLWRPTIGISWHVDLKDSLSSVVWPGGLKSIPKGWEWPIEGTKLQVGIPVKPGFMEFVRLTINSTTHRKGYSLEVFDAVMKELPYTISYQYIKYENAMGMPNGTYDELVHAVYLKQFDAVVGDLTIIANRSLYVDFTLPYTESGVAMLVPVKDKRQKGAWTFLDPLTSDLWLGSGAFFIFTGLVVWFLEHRINEEFRGSPSNQFATIIHFSFSTLVFAHKEKVFNNLSRVVLIIWLAVALVLQSSYTASLTSMLTVRQSQATVTNIDELIKNGDRVGYLNNSFVLGLLEKLKFEYKNLIPYNSPEDYRNALENGTVAAVIDEIPYIRVFLKDYCYLNKYAMLGPIFKNGGFGFAFPKGSPLVPDVSRAILRVTESLNMSDLEKNVYGDQSCDILDDDGISSSSLTFRSFWGLFLVTGVASVCAVIVYLISFMHNHREMLTADVSLCQKLKLLAEIFDKKETTNTSRKDVSKDEQVNNDNSSAQATTEAGSPARVSISAHENNGAEDENQSISDPTSVPIPPDENNEAENENGSLSEHEGIHEMEVDHGGSDPPPFNED